jgi:hypothetical protein
MSSADLTLDNVGKATRPSVHLAESIQFSDEGVPDVR